MLRAEPLYRVRIIVLASEMQDAALTLARFGDFNPAAGDVPRLAEAPAAAYREAWLEAAARLSKLVERCGVDTPLVLPEAAEAPALSDLLALNDWLKTVWGACSACHDRQTRVDDARAHLASLEDTLAKLEHLDVDVSQLLHPGSLLAADIGSVPAAGIRRLADALAMSGYLLSRFDQVGEQVFAVIAGPRERHGEIAGLLTQAGWREMPVPDELRTDPRAARKWLEAERRSLDAQSVSACRVLDGLRSEIASRLDEARVSLALARPLADAALVGVGGRGALAALWGWVPKREIEALRARLDTHFHGRYVLELREPGRREVAEVPSLMRYPDWLTPFVPLVKSYGVPRYGEFDPSLPFAITWLLLFGAMFGDVGHGAVLLLLAAGLRRRLGLLAWVGIAAGASSMLFGVLYGSIFGYEDLIAPLWLSPLHDPVRMLALAVAFGVGFIALTLLANAYNRAVAGRASDALFDAGGLAGLMFYLGGAGTLAAWAGVFASAEFFIAMAVLGLASIAGFKWHESRAGWGERLLVTAIESFETAVSLFSNTLSFMRVAAFSLNHVALALAVFTLAGGLGAAGHGLTIVLGNVVIIVLEGGIVAIQALRLMYYEGFSRFFSADGREFAPLRLPSQPQPI